MVRALVILLAVGCFKSAPPAVPEAAPEVAPPKEPAPEPPARIDYAVGESPMASVVAGDRLVWTDAAGAIWMRRLGHGKPTQLSDQHGIGFMFRPVVAGGDVYVSTKRDFAKVSLPTGRVDKLGLALAENPEQVIADDRAIYVTLFRRDEVMAIPLDGSAPTKLFVVRRGVLAQHGDRVYAVSYSTGVLGWVPKRGGAMRTVTSRFRRPTALAVDDTHAFVYTEVDKTLHMVAIASGATTVLATDLENADEVVSDGEWLYTFSWPSRVLAIAKDGSRTEVLADDLKSPSHIAVDAEAIYVVSRDQRKIVRLLKPQ
jgi:hypothetical protein